MLPVYIFAWVIWQKSGFQPEVIGTVPRSDESAQDIARFRPVPHGGRLLEPFNPVKALPKSGGVLAESRKPFGTFGLAATDMLAPSACANSCGLTANAYPQLPTGDQESGQGGLQQTKQGRVARRPRHGELS